MKKLPTILAFLAAALVPIWAQVSDWRPANGLLPALSTPVGISPDGSPLYLARSSRPGAGSLGWFDPRARRAFLIGPRLTPAVGGYEVYSGAGRWVAGSAGSIPPDAMSAGTGPDGQPLYILRVSRGGWLVPAVYSASDGAAVTFIAGQRQLFSTFEVLAPDWASAGDTNAVSQAFRGATDADGSPLVPFRSPMAGGVQPGKYRTRNGQGYVSYGGKELPVQTPSDEVFIGSGAWVPVRGGLPLGAIPAGRDSDGTTLYMIRTGVNGAQSLGKYSARRGEAYVPYGGAEIKVTSFEVLCYDLSRNRPDSMAAAAAAPVPLPPVTAAAAPPGWRTLGFPSPQVESLTVDTEDEQTLYASGGYVGLYVSRDSGASWTQALRAPVGKVVADPRPGGKLYVPAAGRVLASADKGASWTPIGQFPDNIASMVVSRTGCIIAAPRNNTKIPSGIYRSTDGGQSWSHSNFPTSLMQLICWDIQQDSRSGFIYVSTEFADHRPGFEPKPYRPPFFRSKDDGVTWEDVTGAINYHVVRIQIGAHQEVFALTEGRGLFVSSDYGASWQPISAPFHLSLFADPVRPGVIYGGNHTYQGSGGAFISSDDGRTWTPFGLGGNVVGDFSMNRSGSKLFVAAYGTGLFVEDLAP